MRDATPLLFDLPGFRVIECVEELGASEDRNPRSQKTPAAWEGMGGPPPIIASEHPPKRRETEASLPHRRA